MANKFSKNDEAVSAVIGVILMVAITVILAAVIAAFVFGMGSSIKKTYVVSYTIDRTADGSIVITNTGGPDVGKLASTNPITVSYPATQGATATTAVEPLGLVGSTFTVPSTASPCHVIVIGLFKDGTSQVLATADV